MAQTFRQAFIAALERTGISVNKVAEATGVSVHQLKKLKEGKSQSTNVDDALKIAAFFGESLVGFIDAPELKADIELAQLLSQLTEKEREILLSVARAQLDARADPQK